MATTFLTLVNDINKRLNEVELTSSNFASATGFYAHAKDAVNSGIRYIKLYRAVEIASGRRILRPYKCIPLTMSAKLSGSR